MKLNITAPVAMFLLSALANFSYAQTGVVPKAMGKWWPGYYMYR